jgi:enoyl-CoA hydratase/carnithine racemase
MTNDSNVLLIERKENISTLTINRPDKRNSLTPEVLMLMHQELTEYAKGDDVRAVIIRGIGDVAFSSGYDIRAIPTRDTPELERNAGNKNYLEMAQDSIVNFPYPVIAMLNGYAFGGGCELAISCDIRVGADDIRMGMPPAKLGLIYSVNGLMRFIRVVGWGRTKEIFFTGRYYDAERVKEFGMVDYLLPRSELQHFTYELANEIAGNSPLSLKGTKRILNMIAKQSLNEQDQKEANKLIGESFASDDLKEGQMAFLQKRQAVFKGK